MDLSSRLLWDHSEDGLVHYRRGLVLLCDTKFDAAAKSLKLARAYDGAKTEARRAFDLVYRIHSLDYRLDPVMNGPLSVASRADLEELKPIAEELCWDWSLLLNRVFLRDVDILRLEGQPTEQRLDVIKRYIARSPKFATLWIKKGDVFFDRSEWDLAIDAYKEAQRRGDVLEGGVRIREAEEQRWEEGKDDL
jgi:hypothetical protein